VERRRLASSSITTKVADLAGLSFALLQLMDSLQEGHGWDFAFSSIPLITLFALSEDSDRDPPSCLQNRMVSLGQALPQPLQALRVPI
jgi:hypothetical protein